MCFSESSNFILYCLHIAVRRLFFEGKQNTLNSSIFFYRFVFTNSGALKLEKDVEFEVGGLDLTPFLSGPLHSEDSRPIFDMYGCVCHFGCVYGGHYTAFSRHLGTDQWNHFNDNCIQESKVPGESQGDNGSAYILFYQRAGTMLFHSLLYST